MALCLWSFPTLGRGLSADTPRGKKRAGHASRNSNAVTTGIQKLCHRSIAVLVEPRSGVRRGEERAPRWPTTRPGKSALRDARTLWTVGRYSTGRKARGPRATGFERGDHITFCRPCRGPVAVLVRSSPGRRRGRSAPCVGPQHNHAKSALRGTHVSWAVGRYSTRRKNVRAARHKDCTKWPRSIEARAADLSRCWCGRASPDGAGRSAPLVGPQYNHFKSAERRVVRTLWAVGQYSTGR